MVMACLPFVCELCTVRTNVGREIGVYEGDIQLLALERLRMIYSAHGWGESTLKGYDHNLNHIPKFEKRFGVQITVPLKLTPPPRAPPYLCSGVWLSTLCTLPQTTAATLSQSVSIPPGLYSRPCLYLPRGVIAPLHLTQHTSTRI
jgi:hypothetical protein